MYGRHFLTLSHFTREEVLRILEVSLELKKAEKDGRPHRLLEGKALAMIFQKPSNRTRVSFEVGMYHLGGKTINLLPGEIKMGERETVADVSQVMSRYVQGVMMRVLRHTDITAFAQASSVPVINGLSDLFHPCQAVSDMLTIYEHKGRLEGLKLCYIGDGNNVCNSLILLAEKTGMEMVVSCPEGYEPYLDSKRCAYELIRDPHAAARGADVVYTDVWTSMGQEEETVKRLRVFEGYTISEELLSSARSDAIFMHCLPAHRGEEVEDAVIDGPRSVVFDQAENRLHAQKAVLVLLMKQ
jgi:ornithine carbamoyltransferase